MKQPAFLLLLVLSVMGCGATPTNIDDEFEYYAPSMARQHCAIPDKGPDSRSEYTLYNSKVSYPIEGQPWVKEVNVAAVLGGKKQYKLNIVTKTSPTTYSFICRAFWDDIPSWFDSVYALSPKQR